MIERGKDMASKKTAKKTAAKKVIVRAYSGVFVGELVEKTGGPESFAVVLANARHVWSWTSTGLPRKALNVADLAAIGAGTGTKISGVVDEQTIADVKTISTLTEEAAKRFAELPCLT